MHKRLIILIAVAMLTVLPAVSAQAAENDGTIDINGAGWGHGVGMSQYGSYGRALEGQTYDEILTAYYTGASISTFGETANDPGPLFTNVASDRTSTTLTVFDGPGTPRTGMVLTQVTGGATPPTAVLMSGDKVVIEDTTPQIGAPHGCKATLTISNVVTGWPAGPCDFTVDLTPGSEVPTNAVRATNCRTANCTYGYGTALHLVDNASWQRSTPDLIGGANGLAWQGFDMVVETSLDEYAMGIAEVPFSWHADALKTQAVAARSYAASFIVATNHKDAGCFCDVKNDSSYQVYAGWIDGWPFKDSWIAAARATDGKILTHPVAPDAGIVRAYYSSSNGGASEWVAEKWVANLPYLISVPDPYSLIPQNPLASWNFTPTAATVVAKVWGSSSDNVLVGAEVTERNVSGSAKTVRFTAQQPDATLVTKDLSSATVTSMFGLYSWYFDIDDSDLSSTPPPPPGASDATTVGVQDPRTGQWHLRRPDGTAHTFYYGDPNDIPFIGDWDGSGSETVGLYRKSVGFLFLRNSNTQGVADVDIYYGNPGDVPIAGDWNGDGTDTIGIYRPSEARFYLRNTNTQGVADIDMPFGISGDQPIAGDWDGDGVDTVGVYRPSTKMLYLTNSVPGGSVDLAYLYEGASSGDEIVAGDWDGNGIDTVGVFRSSTATFYLRDTFTQANANIVIDFGNYWMNPIAGNWGG